MKKVLVTQFRNEEKRLREYIRWNLNQGVDFFFFYDDFSEDIGPAVIAYELLPMQYHLQKTDGKGAFWDRTNPQATMGQLRETVLRTCRSMNDGLQRAKVMAGPHGRCAVGFFEVDEFLHTPNPEWKAWDVLEEQLLENDGFIALRSFDVQDTFNLNRPPILTQPDTCYRWNVEDIAKTPFAGRCKSACLSDAIDEIPEREGVGVHSLGKTSYKLFNPDILRIHHYRLPSLYPKFSCFDDTLYKKAL